ncbi:unnamed protein product, partial [Ectocarpus sp. 13 AM-2016]
MSLKSPLNTTDTAIVLKRGGFRVNPENGSSQISPRLRRTSPTQRYILLGDAMVEKRASKTTEERDSSRSFYQSIHASPQTNHKRDYMFPMLLSVAHPKRYPARSTRYKTKRDALCRRRCCCSRLVLLAHTNQPRSKQSSTKVQTTS